MTYPCSIEKNATRGLTKAYGITEKMIEEEGSFEGWGWFREAFSHEFDVMEEEMTIGSIAIHDHFGTGLVIEGLMPHQNSDRGNPKYDMTCALVEMAKAAVRSVEEMMLLSNYKLSGINSVSIIDADAYINAVLEKTLKLASDDNAIFLNYKLDEGVYTLLVDELKANNKTLYLGITTLDYFARLDAITSVLDYDFWVFHVDKAMSQALLLIEDSLLELAVRMGMGRVVYDSNGKAVIEDSITTSAIYIEKNGEQEGRVIDY
ncbi:MAG: hypothetical protein J6N72_03090 [Psychrobacter sp.]|nr:hypothetical protein [Psychrobacter sp.]